MQEALWGLGLWILSHTLCSGSAMLFFQGRRAIDRPVPTLGAEQSSQAGMGEVSGATSLLHCLQFALGRFELKFGKKQSENLKHSKRSEGRAQTAFCWQSLCLFQGDFLFLILLYKISPVLPMSSPEFFSKHFCGFSSQLVQSRQCALGSSRAAQVGDGPGRGDIWGVLLPCCDGPCLLFYLVVCLIQTGSNAAMQRHFLGELFKIPSSTHWCSFSTDIPSAPAPASKGADSSLS